VRRQTSNNKTAMINTNNYDIQMLKISNHNKQTSDNDMNHTKNSPRHTKGKWSIS